MMDRIEQHVRRYSIAYTIVLLLLFFWGTTFFIRYDNNREFWTNISALVFLIVAAAWIPETWRILRDNKTNGESLLILSTSLLAWVILENRGLAVLNYYFDRPKWIVDSSWPTFLAFQFFWLGVLKMAALIRKQYEMFGGVPDGYIPRLFTTMAIIGFLFGVVLGLVVVSMSL